MHGKITLKKKKKPPVRFLFSVGLQTIIYRSGTFLKADTSSLVMIQNFRHIVVEPILLRWSAYLAHRHQISLREENYEQSFLQKRVSWKSSTSSPSILFYFSLTIVCFSR